MLCGIGGRTIAEAQVNLTYREYLSWIRYRNKYGSLHPGMRVDRAVGRGLAFFGNMYSKKKDLKPEDFSPYDKTPDLDEGTADDAFQILASVAKSNE